MTVRAILVEFTVALADRERARVLILANAAASLANEGGCLRFDVLADVADPCRFVLYELYRSAADFDAHLRSAHFQGFGDATRDLFLTRAIRHLDLQNNG
jgi:(4S)-4-hydroxy-5-phosphonooxypentane-2,3-dione isomerase